MNRPVFAPGGPPVSTPQTGSGMDTRGVYNAQTINPSPFNFTQPGKTKTFANQIINTGLFNYDTTAGPGKHQWNLNQIPSYDFAPETTPGADGGFDWSHLFGPGGGGGGGFGGGGGISSGSASPGHASSFHGTAAQIDTNDPIYSLFAPKPWMSGMLSKGKELLSASTEDNLRLMRDNATRSGISTSSPAYLYMVSMQRRDQEKALANALRDANLAWTLPAADRRHGALGQNASMLTNMSDANAGRDTSVSMANAGYATQASIANAGNATSANIAAAGNSLQGQIASAQLGQQGWMFQTNFIRQMANDQWDHAQQIATAQSGQQYIPPHDYVNDALTFAGGL